jgi:TM2 domain-containing membrane protein YozV
MRNKFVAALLAFFGGAIGLHKFYLRESGAGIFYVFLMMMTADVFPVSVILGIIDGLRYLMMPQEEFDRKFNRQYKTRRTTNTSKRQRRQREYYEVNKPKASSKKTTRRSRVRNNPFKKSGMKKYKDYDIEEAIDDFHKGLKIEPHDIALHFNLACAYSLMEDKEEAFKHLDDAIKNGLKDTDKILSHDDLAFLRIQPEFDAFKANGFQLTKRQIQEEDKNEEEQVSKKPMDDILLAQLNRLMELRKKGVLTEQEFTRERKKILVR